VALVGIFAPAPTGHNNLRAAEYLSAPIVTGRAKHGKIISHHIPTDDATGAYDKFDKRINGYTKVLIKFGRKEEGGLIFDRQRTRVIFIIGLLPRNYRRLV